MQELSRMNSNVETMSSLEISELVSSRHDKTKQSIERLMANKIIKSYPPVGDGIVVGNGKETLVYKVSKRDSYVIVAQLSPEFTAKLVDRWQELEEKETKNLIPTNFREALLLAAEQQLTIDNQKEDITLLEIKVDENSDYSTVKRVEGLTGDNINWQPLKRASIRLELEIIKVPDVNYPAGVNSYHKDAWVSAYGIDIKDI